MNYFDLKCEFGVTEFEVCFVLWKVKKLLPINIQPYC